MNQFTIPHYDAIVIGAGSVGVPIAMNLAENNIRTLVLDSTASPGQGSNKHAIGGIRATHSDPAKIRLCLRSIEIFSTWKQLHGDDIEWFQGGYLFIAYREEEEQVLKTLLAKQKTYGLNIDWLSSQDLLALTPHLNPAGLIGGVYSPEDGSASPLLALHAFYRQAVRHGAHFRFGEHVEEIHQQSGRVLGVRTNQGRYSADVIINAAGAYASQLGRLTGIELPVTPDSHEAAITEPVARFLDPMIVDIRPTANSANFYFYQHITGQVMFCITPNPSIWGYDTRETSEFLPMVSRRMLDVMPALRNLRVRRTWRGLYPMTPDGFPIVGWSDLQGLMLAVGMCGQGFMLGPAIGELLSRVVMGKSIEGDDEILEILSPHRKFVEQEKLK